jgi:hypothetical protein
MNAVQLNLLEIGFVYSLVTLITWLSGIWLCRERLERRDEIGLGVFFAGLIWPLALLVGAAGAVVYYTHAIITKLYSIKIGNPKA